MSFKLNPTGSYVCLRPTDPVQESSPPESKPSPPGSFVHLRPKDPSQDSSSPGCFYPRRSIADSSFVPDHIIPRRISAQNTSYSSSSSPPPPYENIRSNARLHSAFKAPPVRSALKQTTRREASSPPPPSLRSTFRSYSPPFRSVLKPSTRRRTSPPPRSALKQTTRRQPSSPPPSTRSTLHTFRSSSPPSIYPSPPPSPTPPKTYPPNWLCTAAFTPPQIRSGTARCFTELNFDFWDACRPGIGPSAQDDWEEVFGEYEYYCRVKRDRDILVAEIWPAKVMLHQVVMQFVGGEMERAERMAGALVDGEDIVQFARETCDEHRFTYPGGTGKMVKRMGIIS